MNKISCEICQDLMPLVKDEVASTDSQKAVFLHMQSCEACKAIYGEEISFGESDKNIISKLKKHVAKISFVVISLCILFGISLSANQFMFYNVLIMPAIGLASFFTLKHKSIFVALSVFALVYLRWLSDSIGLAFDGYFLQAFAVPFSWALIYFSLVSLGILIGFLLHFGFRKEQTNEKDS